MSTAVFELDVDVVPASAPSTETTVREIEENAALTRTTVNTYGLGIAMCVPCC
ncbi:hypothetical protein GCM10010174_63770 [Kutzneria viridogrisea]|uniref:Uncharacterized protein n=1 Tax=Kutzneria viridogrisea TaxID=47990 RepID=A0ABR6BFR3_9PSEU|nr:hypothetical protein [Kutzneria viridogrisea]